MLELEIFPHLSKGTCDKILDIIQRLPENIWETRTELGRGRGVFSNTDCKYDFLGEASMPLSLQEYLKKHAPQSDFTLKEVCINRYQKGDFIGPHRDMDLSIKNIVIALEDSDNGLLNNTDNVFIEDKKGQAICLTGIGPVHSVPPVNKLRYVIIYLFG